MAEPIEVVLDFENLTSIAQATKGLANHIPESFFRVGGTFSGNSGKYEKVDGNRMLAHYCAYTEPARRRGKQGITSVPVNLIHNRESQNYESATLINLRSESSAAKQRMGEQTVARQTANFAQMFKNARMSAISTALANGILYIGSDGELLGSSSGSAFSVDYDIPAGNQSQLNILGGGDLLSDNWDTAASDLIGDMEAVFRAYEQNYGGQLRYAFYGKNIPGYMKNNTALQSYVSGDPMLSSQAVTNQSLPSYFGLTWLPLTAYWENASGTLVDAVDSDALVLCPEPDPSWWEIIEGSFAVPRTINAPANAMEALGSFEEVFGMGSYAQVMYNPPSVEQYMFDTFLPVIKAPKAILQATVPTS